MVMPFKLGTGTGGSSGSASLAILKDGDSVSGAFTESLAITDWDVQITNALTGANLASGSTSGNSFDIACDTSAPLFATMYPHIDQVWTAETAIAVGKYVVATDLEAVPHLFQVATVNLPDPDFADVKVQLHFDGADNSTTFPDSSLNTKTVTRAGSTAKISATQSKFGGTSAFLNGDYLIVSADDDFIVGTGDVTIECFALAGSAPSNNGVFANNLPASQEGIAVAYTGGAWQMYANNGMHNSVAYEWPANTWIHVAYVRYQGVAKTYIGGIEMISAADTLDKTTNTMYVGAYYSAGFNWPGYIDEFIVTKRAKWTENFTPPTGPAPDVGRSGTTEPEWNLMGQTTDGDIIYDHVAALPRPVTAGPI
jgi:hypothetical protein